MNAPEMTEPWVSIDEVVSHLEVTKDSVYRWIESRRPPEHKVGRHWRFKLSEIDEWIRCGQSADFVGSHLDPSATDKAVSWVVSAASERR